MKQQPAPELRDLFNPIIKGSFSLGAALGVGTLATNVGLPAYNDSVPFTYKLTKSLLRNAPDPAVDKSIPPALTGSFTDTFGPGYVTHIVKEEDAIIVNKTVPGHPFHPGMVVRTLVTDNDGSYSVVSYGIGNTILGDNNAGSSLAKVNDIFGNYLFAEASADLIYQQAKANALARTQGATNDNCTKSNTPEEIDELITDLPTASPFATPPRIDPLILDLDGDGIELVSVADSTAFFDMNVDGFAERTGWVDKDDGLLVIDTNGNDRIDDGSELFGDQAGFAHGFAQLAALDSNQDGVMDARDAAFNQLKIWRDTNQDGVSDAAELHTLADLNIATIDLNYQASTGSIAGHDKLFQSQVSMTDGTQREVVDVNLASDLRLSVESLPDDFAYHPHALVMPVLWGYGQISNTWVSLSRDEDLRIQAKGLLVLSG